MNKHKYAIVFGLIAVTVQALCGIEGKFVFKVVDEQGTPIKDAVIEMDCVEVVDAKDPSKGYNETPVKGITDRNGCWSMKGQTLDKPAASAQKKGYYDSVVSFVFNNWNTKPWRWHPYEQESTITLRKIKNPIPMYAWNMFRMEYPVKTNDWVGYDMLLAEWMPPYGKGLTEDVQFQVICPFALKDYETTPMKKLTIRFLGEKNGIIKMEEQSIISQSYYKYPYNAPKDGYNQSEFKESIFVTREGDARFETNTGTTNWFFRIRSRMDKNDSFIDGLYGRIRGPFDVDVGSKECTLRLIYYVNPTPNDLNMEFDPKKNLVQKKDAQNAVVRP